MRTHAHIRAILRRLISARNILLPLVELFFVLLDRHRPRDVSLALDFLPQEAQENQTYDKNNTNKILIKIFFFSQVTLFFLRTITLKIILLSTKFCLHALTLRCVHSAWYSCSRYSCFSCAYQTKFD